MDELNAIMLHDEKVRQLIGLYNQELARADKLQAAIDELMGCCEYRTSRGTCGLLDKDDRTYTCSRANCPHIDGGQA